MFNAFLLIFQPFYPTIKLQADSAPLQVLYLKIKMVFSFMNAFLVSSVAIFSTSDRNIPMHLLS
jgi:hypothetical protein